MDNQSRSSFQQGLFKQRECEKKKKHSRTNYLHLAKGNSDGSLTSLMITPATSPPESALPLHFTVSVSPTLGRVPVCFHLSNSYDRQDTELAALPENQCSKLQGVLSCVVVVTQACECVLNFRVQLPGEVSVLLPDGYIMYHTCEQGTGEFSLKLTTA